MAEEYRALLRFVSLLVATVVVFYSASSFFRNAWCNLRQARLVMDLPVSLAIGLAYAASAYATFTNSGQVYFDSVAMFTFFLLLGRFFERRVRQREMLRQTDLSALLPLSCQSWCEDRWETTATRDTRAGARLLCRVGDILPADGTVLTGEGSVNEAAFTGEELPRSVSSGDPITAGTLLVEGQLEVLATTDTANTRIAAMLRVLARAEHEKPRLAKLADQVAGWFVAGVLLTTALVGAWWWQHDPNQALWICLAVLVVSCPCALALATPTAITSAISSLRQRGVLVTGENALEQMNHCKEILFDKTGTLTRGDIRCAEIKVASGTASQAMQIAAALEQHSNHPVAQAFADIDVDAVATGIEVTPGRGVSGRVGDVSYAVGSRDFVAESCATIGAAPDAASHWIVLANHEVVLAWFRLEDRLRDEAKAVMDLLRSQGYRLTLLSGDRSAQVEQVAKELSMDDFRGACSPDDKLTYIQSRQQCGARVAMVGDGLNDAPVLAAADCSFAVNDATDLAKSRADAILLKPDLSLISTALDTSRRTRRIMFQNIGWALGYNSLALPLAAVGLVPPWAAAIGMSLSSLIVVGNSLRLNR